MKNMIVLIEFADKDNFAIKYKVGQKLEGFDDDRIEKLVKRGLVGPEVIEILDIDLSEHYKKVISNIEAFNDVEKLKLYLAAESEVEKPRASVVKAIEDRIALLEEKEE